MKSITRARYHRIASPFIHLRELQEGHIMTKHRGVVNFRGDNVNCENMGTSANTPHPTSSYHPAFAYNTLKTPNVNTRRPHYFNRRQLIRELRISQPSLHPLKSYHKQEAACRSKMAHSVQLYTTQGYIMPAINISPKAAFAARTFPWSTFGAVVVKAVLDENGLQPHRRYNLMQA